MSEKQGNEKWWQRSHALTIAGLIVAALGTLGALGYAPLKDVALQPYFASAAAPTGITLALCGGVALLWASAVTRKAVAAAAKTAANKRSLDDPARCDRLVQQLHQRWFPAKEGRGMNHDYRISLFVPLPDPGHPEQWECRARSTTVDLPQSWPHFTDRKKLATCGIVVATALDRIPYEVAGVPADVREDKDEVQRYLRESCINEEQHKQRSWRWASLTTTYACNASGQITHILVIENESGLPIHASGSGTTNGSEAAKDSSRDIVGTEMAFAATIWAIAGEN